MKRLLLIIFFVGLGYAVSGYSQTDNTVLTVSLYPAEINSLGAGWRVLELDSDWFPSGNMLVLSEGIYTIDFKGDIKGWEKPERVQVTLEKGKVTSYKGVYTRLKGSLKVIISPTEVVEAGAQWRRAGEEEWIDSNEIEADIPIDRYEIEFKKISGWKVPSQTVVDLQTGIVNLVTASYTRAQGQLQVNILPKEAVDAGAMWKIAGETTYNTSGTTITKNVGEYTVEFRTIPNWQSPEAVQVKVAEDENTVITVAYIPAELQEGEGNEEGEGVGEGEGEGENPQPTSCGCDNGKGIKDLKQLFNNLFIFGMGFVILGIWTGISKGKNRE